MHASKPPSDRASRLLLLRRLKESTPAGGPAADVPPMPLGCPEIEAVLPRGGLGREALHEVAPETAADWPAALGFVSALCARGLAEAEGSALLAASEPSLSGFGRLDGHGLNGLGLDPGRLLLVGAETDTDVLWALEESLRARALAVVAGLLGSGLDLKAGRRLLLAAAGSGALLLVLRPAGADAVNGAATRWRVRAAPAGQDRFGLIDRLRWHLSLERCRNGRPGDWIVEWDHEARGVRVAEAVADRALHDRAGKGERDRRVG